MGSLICSERQPNLSGDPLQEDCARCRALCCILLPFDVDQGFAFAKDAGTPCRNLTPDFRCSVHADLAGHGFPGCARYSCHGAGQYVTALLELHGNWHENDALLREAYALFATTRTLHARLKARRPSSG